MAVTHVGPGLFAMTAAADAINMRMKVKKFRWVNVGALSAADDALIIDDSGGGVIWETEASGANYVESDIEERWVDGVVIDTITRGTLYVYYE